MAAKLYTFKITYADCGGRIWRTAAVSSNYRLVDLGYLVLATFDTMAYHLFEMKYGDTIFLLSEEDLEDLSFDESKDYDKDYDLMYLHKIGSRRLDLEIGDTIEMTYDFGCGQVFNIELLEINDMPKGSGRAYPKILDGAGKGIVDDMPAYELLEAIQKIDAESHSGIFYSSSGSDNAPEWDYRNYDLNYDNMLLKGNIEIIRDGYENPEE